MTKFWLNSESTVPRSHSAAYNCETSRLLTKDKSSWSILLDHSTSWSGLWNLPIIAQSGISALNSVPPDWTQSCSSGQARVPLFTLPSKKTLTFPILREVQTIHCTVSVMATSHFFPQARQIVEAQLQTWTRTSSLESTWKDMKCVFYPNYCRVQRFACYL